MTSRATFFILANCPFPGNSFHTWAVGDNESPGVIGSPGLSEATPLFLGKLQVDIATRVMRVSAWYLAWKLRGAFPSLSVSEEYS